jgi:hypothetical protein
MKQWTGRFIGVVSLLIPFLSGGGDAQLSLVVSRAICALVSEVKNNRTRGGRGSFFADSLLFAGPFIPRAAMPPDVRKVAYVS